MQPTTSSPVPINQVLEMLKVGDAKDLGSLQSTTDYELLLNQYSFGGPYEEIYRKIIDNMLGLERPLWGSLRFQSCSVITDEDIKKLLASSSGLQQIRFIECPNISSSTIRFIAATCPQVKTLVVKKCEKVERMHSPRRGNLSRRSSSSSKFVALRTLQISGCSIKRLTLPAPMLEVFKAKKCPQLSDLCLLTPKIKTVDVRGCKSLTAFSLNPVSGSTRKRSFRRPLSPRSAIAAVQQKVMGGGDRSSLDLSNTQTFHFDGCSQLPLKAIEDVVIRYPNAKVTARGCTHLIEGPHGELTERCPHLLQYSLGKFSDNVVELFLKTLCYGNNVLVMKNVTLRKEAARALQDVLRYCPPLQMVSLNKIKPNVDSLVPSLTQHTSLTSLNITECPLTERGMVALVEGLPTLKNLIHIILQSNRVKPQAIETMTGQLKQLPSVRTISFAGNPVTKQALCSLGKAVENLSLTQLDLSGCITGGKDDWVKTLTEQLSSLKSVFLRLRRNSIRGERLEPVLTTFKHVDLGRNNIDDRDRNPIIRVFTANKGPATLLLSGNAIEELGALKLVEALFDNDTPLRALGLAANPIPCENAQLFAETFFRRLSLQHLTIQPNDNSDNPTISKLPSSVRVSKIYDTRTIASRPHLGVNLFRLMRNEAWRNKIRFLVRTQAYLNLSGQEIGDEGVRVISHTLADSRCSLTYLDLSDSDTGDKGAKSLARALGSMGGGMIGRARCPNMIHALLLHGNPIKDEGARAFAELLERNPPLEMLTLGCFAQHTTSEKTTVTPHHSLTTASIMRLMQALEKNSKLGYLGVYASRFDDQEVLALTKALNEGNVSCLRVLDLRSCTLTREAWLQFCRMVGNNTSLQRLILDKTGLTDEDLKPLLHALKTNNSLYDISLKGNDISENLKRQIRKVTQRNEPRTIGPSAIWERGRSELVPPVDLFEIDHRVYNTTNSPR